MYDDESLNQHFTEEEIIRLYSRFRAFDETGDGRIAMSDILRLKPELAENPLMNRVMSVFDRDGDGKVSFVEFITGLARVTHDEASKVQFLFEVYDLNKDGFVSNADLFRVVKMMAGENLSPFQLQQLVDRTIRDCDKDGDGKLNFEEFKAAISHLSLAKQLDVDM